MLAIISGGASGLGLATAKRLAKVGVKVAIFKCGSSIKRIMALGVSL